MKNHILHDLGIEKKIKEDKKFYYDDKEQISFVDDNKTIKVVSLKRNIRTTQSRMIEVSDPDCFNLMNRTRLTETGGEVSDADELLSIGESRNTFKIENSDPDEFLV